MTATPLTAPKTHILFWLLQSIMQCIEVGAVFFYSFGKAKFSINKDKI